jgi:hypothetical protein
MTVEAMYGIPLGKDGVGGVNMQLPPPQKSPGHDVWVTHQITQMLFSLVARSHLKERICNFRNLHHLSEFLSTCRLSRTANAGVAWRMSSFCLKCPNDKAKIKPLAVKS